VNLREVLGLSDGSPTRRRPRRTPTDWELQPEGPIPGLVVLRVPWHTNCYYLNLIDLSPGNQCMGENTLDASSPSASNSIRAFPVKTSYRWIVGCRPISFRFGAEENGRMTYARINRLPWQRFVSNSASQNLNQLTSAVLRRGPEPEFGSIKVKV